MLLTLSIPRLRSTQSLLGSQPSFLFSLGSRFHVCLGPSLVLCKVCLESLWPMERLKGNTHKSRGAFLLYSMHVYLLSSNWWVLPSGVRQHLHVSKISNLLVTMPFQAGTENYMLMYPPRARTVKLPVLGPVTTCYFAFSE